MNVAVVVNLHEPDLACPVTVHCITVSILVELEAMVTVGT